MRNLKRYTLPIILGALALILLVVGILATTIWSPAQAVVAVRSTDQPFTVTRAGVLRLYEPHQQNASVRVEATTEGDATVWVALGSPDDVNAWVQNEPYDEITGLQDLETLKAVTHEGAGPAVTDEAQSGEEAVAEEEGEEQPQSGEEADNPISSDMWTAVKYGKHSVSMTLTGDELDQSILAATDGVGPAPTIILSWDTPQQNLLALFAYSLMAAMAVLALATWGFLFVSRKRKPADQVPAALQPLLPATESAEPAEIESAETVEHAEEVIDAGEISDELGEIDQVDEQLAQIEEAEAQQVSFVVDSDGQVDDAAELEDLEVESADAEGLQYEEVVTEAVGDEVVQTVQAEMFDDQVEETVTTDSGMMNLSALQRGFGYPTRRALRDAEQRGVDHLVIGDRKFSTKTGEVPVVSSEDTEPEASEAAGSDAAPKRRLSSRPLSWSQLMGRAAERKEASADHTEGEGN